MKLLSVNVSLPREVPYHGKTITTGIFKEPVDGRVMVRRLNIDGDGQADLKVHGGEDMAVYAYPFEHYAFWEKELGSSGFPFGQFGENLTVQGTSEDAVRVGDVFRAGGSLLQVTQPRIPCYKLALRMGEGMDFPKRYQQSGRAGFYFRVLEEGQIGAGDVMERIDTDPNSVTIAEFIHIYLHETHEPQSLDRLLASRDLGKAWRDYLKKMLEKARPTPGPISWNGYRTFFVDRKVPESETITSFYLIPEDGQVIHPFKPGQFLTFRLEIPGQPNPVTRTYTISDRPNADYYRLSIKREAPPADHPDLPPGLSSNYFHDDVAPGTRLCVKAPRGEFWLDPGDDTPVVLLAGGVGVTPMISMLNALVAAGSKRPVWFVHGTRNGREHAFGEHVRRLAAQHDNIHLHVQYSRPAPEDAEGQHYNGVGHVSVDLLERILPPAAYDFYLCGPTPFMKSLYNGLLDWGVPEGRIHYEFFGPVAALKEGAENISRPQSRNADSPDIEVVFEKSATTVAWDPGVDSILELAEAHGLHPDFSCRSGICHTCMCRLVSGEVDYVVEPAELPDPGCVLICCSRPASDVTIDL
ncbi:MAG: MOSC domain-containing protein [Pseudomonadota bacterium]|nr:MOSC domain-containing protein [Pseudomonadota bacterium]